MKRHKSSPFRFITSSRRGEYSVWRGDEPIGFVTKNVHYLHGVAYKSWIPTLPSRRELATRATREEAAWALWDERA